MSKPAFNIGIAGCGKMGKDLFTWLINFPYPVTWVCHSKAQALQQQEIFEKKLNRDIKYGLADDETINFRMKNTLVTSRLEKLSGCNLVLESITEDVRKKRELYRKLERILPHDGILASNSSSISPDELFHGLMMEKNALGLHFFYPASMKNMVEINLARNTSVEVVARVEMFLEKVDRFYLKLTNNDHFILNRMFLKMQAGCCCLVKEGTTSMKEIDQLVKENLFPAGIFEFFDYVGNDVMLQSVKNYIMYENDPAFYTPMIELLGKKVDEGKLGKKTKAGFYDYPVKHKADARVEAEKQQKVLQQIVIWYLDGVFNTLNRDICNKDELTYLVKEYMATGQSPFQLADEMGYVPNN